MHCPSTPVLNRVEFCFLFNLSTIQILFQHVTRHESICYASKSRTPESTKSFPLRVRCECHLPVRGGGRLLGRSFCCFQVNMAWLEPKARQMPSGTKLDKERCDVADARCGAAPTRHPRGGWRVLGFDAVGLERRKRRKFLRNGCCLLYT